MTNLSKKLEMLANVAIVLVAVLLVGVVVQRYFIGDRSVPPPEIALGTKVSVPGVDWAQNKQTLLVVLQKGCHFCSESAPFYQRLAREAGQNNVRLVAVLPNETSVGRQYLAELGVPIEDVRQAALNSVGVRGTPTLMMVNEQGAVTGSWVGKLPEDKEADVINQLRSAIAATTTEH